MGGRQILGVVLVALGLVAVVVGLVGLLGDDGGDATAESSPAGVTAASPTGPTSSEPTGPTATSPTGPTAISPTGPTATGPTGPTATGPAEEPETPEEFFAALGAAFAQGDQRFLSSRLHPFATERYGASQCRALFASFDLPDYDVEVLSVGDVAPFVYETDGLRRRVEGATTVRIRFTEDGSTFVETDTHIVLNGDRFLWLTDCGAPLAGAA